MTHYFITNSNLTDLKCNDYMSAIQQYVEKSWTEMLVFRPDLSSK